MKQIFSITWLFILFACNSKKDDPQPSSTVEKKDSIPVVQQPPVPTPVVDTIKYDSYCNSRFQYCIDYPKGIIYPQPESTNGDGRVFKNKQGEKVLIVYGRLNMNADGDPMTIGQQYDDDLHGGEEENGNEDRTITYQKLGKDFYVISGYKKGRIFYHKAIVKGDAFAFARLEYNESDKAMFDKVSSHLFASFK